MKKVKTNEGFMYLITEDEMKQIRQIFNEDLPNIEPKDDPLKGFHKSTIDFFNELKDHFGDAKIYARDPFVKKMKRKYFITDLPERLRKLAKNGNCEIEIHKTEKSVKVYSFTLLF